MTSRLVATFYSVAHVHHFRLCHPLPQSSFTQDVSSYIVNGMDDNCRASGLKMGIKELMTTAFVSLLYFNTIFQKVPQLLKWYLLLNVFIHSIRFNLGVKLISSPRY